MKTEIAWMGELTMHNPRPTLRLIVPFTPPPTRWQRFIDWVNPDALRFGWFVGWRVGLAVFIFQLVALALRK